jgi:hypothetical protein
MYLAQVTAGTTATPIMTVGVTPSQAHNYQVLIFQNNSTQVVRVGDSTVSATKGVQLAAAGATNSILIIPLGLEYSGTLEEFFVISTGTAASLDIMVCP